MKFLPLTSCFLLLGSALPGNAAIANEHGNSPCVRSADAMRQACALDAREERRETIASCLHIGDREERQSCRTEANWVKMEADAGCMDQKDARVDVCELLGEQRYDPDPLTGISIAGEAIEFVDPNAIGLTLPANPYLSLELGHTHVLRAGEDFEEIVVVTVTDEIREILDVDCRVVVDVVVVQDGDEYEAIEVTDDWFAQSTDGDVYYCGEIARNFEDGVLRDLDGSFEAGIDLAKSGVLIRATPTIGEAHRQEFLIGEAEDVIQYVDTMTSPVTEEGGDNPLFPCPANGCLKTQEFIPIEPESGEFKYYLPGTGFVLGVALENGEITGERDELVCVGPTLDVLHDPACGLENVDELLEDLCELSPEAFCLDD